MKLKHIACLFLLATNTSFAQTSLDYANEDLWLCHPDSLRFCLQNQSATTINEDGRLKIEPHRFSPTPAFDCFYVYPTVSDDSSANSDVHPGRFEAHAIQAQFARFGEVCRLYAPIYRQATSTALRNLLVGKAADIDRDMLVNDVAAAWQHYLESENDGRGVLLIGHSQGAGVLTELIVNEIDGQEAQNRIVAAYLLGASGVLVPKGRDIGGTFKSMPLCRSKRQTQCIVAFNSFRESTPPSNDTRYGRARKEEERVHLTPACNVPGALEGGSTSLDAYLSTNADNLGSSSKQPSWTKTGTILTTPFVRVPGLLEGECVDKNGFTYLEVRVLGDVKDIRADDIGGDVVINGKVAPEWGLHLIDVHLTMGNLIQLARDQGNAYLESAAGR